MHRIITLISDGKEAIQQQSVWSGYSADVGESRIEVIRDLQAFVNIIQNIKPLQEPEKHVKLLTKKERMNELLDLFKKVQQEPDDALIDW